MCVLRSSQWDPQVAQVCSVAVEGSGKALPSRVRNKPAKEPGEVFTGEGEDGTGHKADERTQGKG